MKQSKVHVKFKNNTLFIGLSGHVKARIIDIILNELKLSNKKLDLARGEMILDLSGVYPISSAGAVALVCICSALMMKRISKALDISAFYLKRPSKPVLSYLETVGFFSQMSNKANLLGCEDLVRNETQKESYRIEKQRKYSVKNDPGNNPKPILLPMETIPQRGGPEEYKYFEDKCQHFVNHVYSTFEKLFVSPHFGFGDADVYGFCSSNGELFVNVFEHSSSWGLGVIHANPARGTSVSFYDIGIGIRESINGSPKVNNEFPKFAFDYDAMRWALKEGNSSKIGGNGRGLNVVEEFVVERRGFIEIRSGECLLRKKPGDMPGEDNWRNYKVPWFPGTQINFFVPCIG